MPINDLRPTGQRIGAIGVDHAHFDFLAGAVHPCTNFWRVGLSCACGDLSNAAINDQRPLIIGVATALGMIVILVMAWLASKFLLPSARKKDQDSHPSDLERRFMLDNSGQSEGPGSIFQKAFDKHPVDSSKKKGQDTALSQPSWENR